MAWEWVAPTGTALVGVSGIVATYLAGRRQASTALTATREQIGASLALGQQQMQGQLALAREERRQRRAEAAYLELLRALNDGQRWAAEVEDYAYDDNRGKQQPRETELVADINEHATLNAVWSPDVQALVMQWRKAVTRVRVGSNQVRRRNMSPQLAAGDPKVLEHLHASEDRLTKATAEMRRLDAQIRQQVWAELNSPVHGTDLVVPLGPKD